MVEVMVVLAVISLSARASTSAMAKLQPDQSDLRGSKAILVRLRRCKAPRPEIKWNRTAQAVAVTPAGRSLNNERQQLEEVAAASAKLVCLTGGDNLSVGVFLGLPASKTEQELR